MPDTLSEPAPQNARIRLVDQDFARASSETPYSYTGMKASLDSHGPNLYGNDSVPNLRVRSRLSRPGKPCPRNYSRATL